MEVTTSSAPQTHAFDPSIWLDVFERTGGAFALCGDRLSLFIIPGDRPGSKLSAAREMITTLGEIERDALTTELRNRAAQPTLRRLDSSAAISDLPRVKATPRAAQVVAREMPPRRSSLPVQHEADVTLTGEN